MSCRPFFSEVARLPRQAGTVSAQPDIGEACQMRPRRSQNRTPIHAYLRRQVVIIGSGPAGLILGGCWRGPASMPSSSSGKSRDFVLSRIRAGVLEDGTVNLLRDLGVGARMDREGLPHDGFALGLNSRRLRIDVKGLTGKPVMVYGQTRSPCDLMDARVAAGAHHDLRGR